MCTVTYVPFKDGAILTSNRDENIARGITLPPQVYIHQNKKIMYPKDEKGNGTWVGYNDENSIAILLNGAFKKHNYNPPYKQSRGVLIPTILQESDPVDALRNFNLKGIEPFSLVVFSNGLLYECRWDGIRLFEKQLNTQGVYCWNSSTLYSEQMEKDNNKELQALMSNNITQDDILKFHKEKKYELQLPVNSKTNNIKTISISQIVTGKNSSNFFYYDLLNISTHTR